MNRMEMKNIYVDLKVGEPLSLPGFVSIEFEGGISERFPVKWKFITPDLLEKPGTLTVKGEIIPDDYPNPLILNRADPYLLKHTDGFYYFTASVPEYDRLVLRRSKTIAGLSSSEEVVIWSKHQKGEMGSHIWAPELHWIDGKWYIYFAAGSAEDVWAIRPYVLECTDNNPLTGTWVEKGRIALPNESFSLDTTTFEHEGQRFLVWAQILEDSCLYIAPMDTPWSISGKPVKISAPEYDWEIQRFRVNEGPAVLKRNGFIFISYSASGTDDRYCMGLLTASATSNLLDVASWTKSKNSVFKSNENLSEYGPGHNSFTISEEGTTDLLVYHARSYKEIIGDPLYDPNRHAHIQRLFWNADGTPFFGEPGWKPDLSIYSVNAIINIYRQFN